MLQKSFLTKTFWFILINCLINAIWIISIPGEKQNFIIFNLSLPRLLLLILIVTPVIFSFFLFNTTVQNLFYRHEKIIIKFGEIISTTILLTGYFFILSLVSKFRFEIDQAIWIRLLPVYVCYIFISIYWLFFSACKVKRIQTEKKAQNKRENFIDFARGFAIILALFSHAFFAFGYGNIFGEYRFIVKTFTRFATPLFVIITGMMFEIVYLKKAKLKGFHYTVSSLVFRAVQCYLAYFIAVWIEWFNHLLTNAEAINAVLFLGQSNVSDILKFYVIFLILGILIIWLRQKFGLWIIAVLPVLVWFGDLFMMKINWPLAGSKISFLTSLIFGHPFISSFSVWHGITFMSFGMLLGYYVNNARQKMKWKGFLNTLTILFIINLVITFFAVYPSLWKEVIFLFANDYRRDHYIAYYSIGSMGALALLWFFWFIRSKLNHNFTLISITSLGKDSLWAFATGNSLAALMPPSNNHLKSVLIFVILVWIGTIMIIYYKNNVFRIINK